MRSFVPLALLAALAAGCSGSNAVATAPLEQPSSTTSPTPSPSPAAVGATQEGSGEGSAVKTTVLRVRQPLRAVVPDLPERAGYEYIGLEVRMCVVTTANSEPTTVSWGPWSIAFADDTVAEALSSWSAEWWSVPLYPQERVVRPGSCVRGWIPFEVPKGSKPTMVTYQPSGIVLEWRVK